MRLVIDTETDGLLDTVSKIHCISTKEIDTGRVRNFGPDEVGRGLKLLARAELLVAHNGIGYDIPAIKKLYPTWETKAKVIDTLVLARVLWPEIKKSDYARWRDGRLPGQLIGAHKLKAWGYRLGVLKGDYGEQENAWEVFTPEMLEYCEQDVHVTDRLWETIQKKKPDPRMVDLELECAWILESQMRTGYPFKEREARALYATLSGARQESYENCRDMVSPWYVPVRKKGVTVVQSPKRDNRTLGYTQDAPFCPVKLVEFNPGSDQQVADRLQELYGWEPTEFTDTGLPSVTEEVLEGIDNDLARAVARYAMLDKRISQLAEGKGAWLSAVKADGRIYGYINQSGTVTGRASHSKPNLGQVPSCKKPYGPECRALFHVPETFDGQEWEQLGTDLSGLELRCLGHFMAAFDRGAYITELLEGDIHTANQLAAGLPDRDMAKTFISMG